MDLLGLIPYLRGGREQDTVDLIQEQVTLVSESVDETRRAVEALTRRDKGLFNSKKERVNDLEDDIDSKTRLIEEKLYSGAFLAVSRSRILDLTEDIDDIADACKDVVNIGESVINLELNEELKKLLLEHMDATVECMKYLMDCVKIMRKTGDMKSCVLKVREQEHTVDEIARKLFKNIHDAGYSGVDYMTLSRMVEFMDDISDRAEAAADALNLIMLVHRP